MGYIGAGITRFNTADELTVTGTSEFGGNVSFGDNNITNVGSLQIDSIAGDADTNTNITFAGSDVITMTTAGSERVRVDSSGNVGIGTASPAQKLTIASEGRLRLYRADNARYGDIYNDNNFLNIETSNDPIKIDGQSYIRFDADGSEKVRVTSGGNVGIGTSSPATKLSLISNGAGGDVHVKNGSGQNALLEMAGNNNTAGSTSALYGQDASGNAYAWNRANLPLLFGTNNAERMRIDSSGNLLVGTTTNGTTADGTVIRASAETLMTRSNGAPLLVNRRGSDGAVIEIRNDNTAVGYINANASGAGIYLGGTGSSNHLDDYEEGTFNVAIASGISVTSYDHNVGHYVKVGRMVTAWVFMEYNGSSRTSSHFVISGLPFTSSNDTSNESTFGGFITYQNGFSNAHNIIHVARNNTKAFFYELDGSDLTGSELSGASGEVRFVVQYTVP